MPIHVAAYIEALSQSPERATVKLHLVAVRCLLDWMTAGGFLTANPATSVKAPALSMKRGRTNVLTAAEVRHRLNSTPLSRVSKSGQVEPVPAGVRDRALIALITFTLARIGRALARIGRALALQVKGVERRNHRLWVRLLERGGKVHNVPCHHTLDAISPSISRSQVRQAVPRPRCSRPSIAAPSS